jgi:tetratricopeptide (TPR) repeat protein
MNTHWSSGERLWTHSVEHGGDPVAHLNLAMSISDRRDPRVRAQLEEAVRMNPNFVVGHIDLGLLLIDLGETAPGLQHVQQAMLLNPGWAQSHYWLATAFRKVGRMQEARVESAAAAQLDPRNLEYNYQAGLDPQNAGDERAVLSYVEQIERVDADYKETRFMKAFALQKLGNNKESIKLYEDMLRQNPEHVQVEINLGYALIADGRCPEAVARLQHVLARYPANSSARNALSQCGVSLKPATPTP